MHDLQRYLLLDFFLFCRKEADSHTRLHERHPVRRLPYTQHLVSDGIFHLTFVATHYTAIARAWLPTRCALTDGSYTTRTAISPGTLRLRGMLRAGRPCSRIFLAAYKSRRP